ncbi:BON domain-containing protein [Kribbella turkmenica]|uniref:BON domain-containing protein n=1 Tax=Kribbella turkmenica TaxID=2530375 RepID=A0A4R4XAW1_9ACTN|nr:BON domain-containing protein [Kribbella turkmenica]TDD27741.1 BON domain-containing protein [Kribbella turkmenica]
MRLIVDRTTRRRGITVKDHGHPFLKSAGLTVAGLCAGMVTEYLMDPDRGRARRARIRDRSAHAAQGMNGGLTGLSRDMTNRGRGIAMTARYRVTGRTADDAVLHDRVRAELGRCVSHPHAVQVRVDAGSVTLVGDVLAEEEKTARHAVKRIPGVKNVDAQWTVHEEPGDVPTLQGKGRSKRSQTTS